MSVEVSQGNCIDLCVRVCLRVRVRRGVRGLDQAEGTAAKAGRQGHSGWGTVTQDGVREEGRGWAVSLAGQSKFWNFILMCVCEATVRIEAKG